MTQRRSRNIARTLVALSPASLSLAAGLGILMGLGAYTFNYAEGTSYFSTNPAACANCHIMNEQYGSWRKGPHHHVAGCVDCHLPHDFLPKYIAKAENGYNHSSKFTLQNFHEPIMITPKNAKILQKSCLSCHADFVHEVIGSSRSSEAGSMQCVHCHKSVGHGPPR